MSRRLRLLCVLLAAVSPALALAVLPRPAPEEPWDGGRLAAGLGRLGYEAHPVARDRLVGAPGGPQRLLSAGVYFVRPGAAPAGAWEEAAAGMLGRPRHGVIVAKPRGPYSASGPDAVEAGPWLLMGAPAELDRVAGALGLSRDGGPGR